MSRVLQWEDCWNVQDLGGSEGGAQLALGCATSLSP
jgi:hypothetical protein